MADSSRSNNFLSPLWFRVALVVAAGLFIYWPALHGDWLWDDTSSIPGTAPGRSLGGLLHIWLSKPDWALTSTLFWLEWHLWGGVPYGYHAVTFALHLAGGLLVWRLLARLGLRLAWLGGLLFIVHPLAVESAAWIAETKNTLSLVLALLALDAWLDHDEGQGRQGYARALFWYFAALLAKTSVVMLPAVLLLYAWWKRGRVTRRDIVAALPFFGLALALGAVTYFCPHGETGAVASAAVHGPGFFARLAGAAGALLFYFGKFVLPVGLLPIYPSWGNNGDLWLDLGLPAALLVLGGWWIWLRGWGRTALFGFGFFALNLLPVLGLFWMVYLDISPVADHFVYLPMIGLIGLVVAGLEQAAPRVKAPLGGIAVAAVALALAWASRGYAGLYLNHQTLWTYTLAHNSAAWPAHNNLGDVYLASGHFREAEAEYKAALASNPDYAGTHSNLGTALLGQGRRDEAVAEYRRAVILDPGVATYHFNLATGLATNGQLPEAVSEYQTAIKIDPDNARAHNNLGNVLLRSGQIDAGVAECQEALRLDPTMVQARVNLGGAYMQAGQFDAAIEQYQETLKLQPNNPSFHYNLGCAMIQAGRYDDAVTELKTALKADPKQVGAWSNLGVALARGGHLREAAKAFQAALLFDPTATAVRKNLEQVELLLQPPSPAATAPTSTNAPPSAK